MVLTASKRTVEILPMCVPWMRQEANFAVATMDRTACQTGMIAQDRIQRGLILTNKRMGAIILMPVRAKCKEFPGGCDKNTRFSVKMLILFDTPSSYELDAQASRSRARFFCGSTQKFCRLDRMMDPSANVRRACRTCAANELSQNPANTTRKEEQLKEQSPLLLFQVAGPFS